MHERGCAGEAKSQATQERGWGGTPERKGNRRGEEWEEKEKKKVLRRGGGERKGNGKGGEGEEMRGSAPYGSTASSFHG